jgi:hypothetical protein
MKMKKTILATAIAASIGGSMSAGAITVSPSGMGDALLVPYYSAQNGNKTFLTITNTTDVAKAVKVRFREGVGSRDVFDFTVYLSERDVWTGLVTRDESRITVMTADSSCTVPEVGLGNGSFSDTRIPAEYTASSNIDRMSEGHIEILDMGWIYGDNDDTTGMVLPDGTTVVHDWITHVDGVPADCESVRDWTAAMAQNAFPASVLVGGPQTDVEVDQIWLPGNGGLYAHAAVFNPADGTYFTYEGDALHGWADGVLWFPQNSTGLDALRPFSNDQGLAWDEGVDDTGFIEYFDLPDLSTPALLPGEGSANYTAERVRVSGSNLVVDSTSTSGNIDQLLVGTVTTGPSAPYTVDLLGSTASLAKTEAVTASLAQATLTNDYITSVGFATEWLITYSSRYLHVHADPYIAGLSLEAWPPFTESEDPVTGLACEEVDFSYWDREEGFPTDPGSIDFSPGGSTPGVFNLCYEVNVLTFNQMRDGASDVLASKTVVGSAGLEDGYENGWGILDFSSFMGLGWAGLPATGFMAVADTSGAVPRGATYRHHQDN